MKKGLIEISQTDKVFMKNVLAGIWILVLAFAIWGFGLSGVTATLMPNEFTVDTVVSALAAWLFVFGLLLSLILLICLGF